MRIHGKSVGGYLSDLYAATKDDNIFNGAAALGFYLTLAIFPAIVFLMAMLPYLPIQNLDQAIMDLLRQALPGEAARMFSGVVHQVTGERRGGLLSFSAVGLLWAASSGMYAIMRQLNITYGVREERPFLRARATALGLTLLFLVLILGALTLVVLGGVIQDWLGSRFGLDDTLLSFFAALRWVIIFTALLLGFALVYYLAPNVEQRFRFISPGSFVGVALLALASVAFALYTQNFGSYDATYGSIGAVIILMMWLYMAGLVILFGSEINVLAERYAGRDPEARGGESRRHKARHGDLAGGAT
jgi:membrane protein